MQYLSMISIIVQSINLFVWVLLKIELKNLKFKYSRGDNSATMKTRVTVLTQCNTSYWYLSLYQVSVYSYEYFWRYSWKSSSFTIQGQVTQQTRKPGLWFLNGAILLIDIYHCTKYHFISMRTFEDIAERDIAYIIYSEKSNKGP